MQRFFSWTIINERFSAERNLMIEVVIAMMLKVVFYRIESVFQDISYKQAILHKLPISGLHFKEPNTTTVNRVEVGMYKNADRPID